jgi:hypothetical protein
LVENRPDGNAPIGRELSTIATNELMDGGKLDGDGSELELGSEVQRFHDPLMDASAG